MKLLLIKNVFGGGEKAKRSTIQLKFLEFDAAKKSVLRIDKLSIKHS